MEIPVYNWFLQNTYSNIQKEVIESQIENVCNSWSKYIKIIFKKQSSLSEFTEKILQQQEHTIEIGFFKGTHKCDEKFDGEKGILAHASFPEQKDVLRLTMHFDSDEPWIFEPNFFTFLGTSPIFYNIALHEMGHILGLDHSTNVDSIMRKTYSHLIYTLSIDDVLNIRKIFEPTEEILPQKDSVFENFFKLYYKSIFMSIFILIFFKIIYKTNNVLRK